MCKIDFSHSTWKFYGNFNNILSVVGYDRSELVAVHLVKTYCVPSSLYGCEAWYMSSNDYHSLNVIWNNSFHKIFGCCWRESVSCLLYYCKTLPMSYIIDHRIILFWKRALNSDNIIIATLARINRNEVGMILSNYNIPSLNLSPYAIKSRMWEHFVDAACDSGKISVL